MQPSRAGVHRWWPFVLVVAAGGGRWVVAAAHPEAGSTVGSGAIGCAWAALLCFLFFRRELVEETLPPTRSLGRAIRSFLTGAMLSAGPGIALAMPGREVDAGNLAVALALTPVVVAIAASALGHERKDDLAGRIWPGLAAAAALLLLLAQPALGNVRNDLAFVLAPAFTGIGAALFCMDTNVFAMRAGWALAGSAAMFTWDIVGTYVATGSIPPISLLAVGCDGVLALLSIGSLYQLGATRWSSQFTWVPLLIVVESLALIRPHLTAHWIFGVGLLTFASIYLLMPQSEERESRISAVPN